MEPPRFDQFQPIRIDTTLVSNICYAISYQWKWTMSEIDKKYIENRVNDWKKRIVDIFSFVKESCSNHPEIDFGENKTTQMHEELMQKFGVSPVELPILEIKKNKELLASFKPKGLWVIGANGRIDILTKEGSFILVDISEKEEPSIWKVFAPSNRRKSVDFDKKFITDLVKS